MRRRLAIHGFRFFGHGLSPFSPSNVNKDADAFLLQLDCNLLNFVNIHQSTQTKQGLKIQGLQQSSFQVRAVGHTSKTCEIEAFNLGLTTTPRLGGVT